MTSVSSAQVKANHILFDNIFSYTPEFQYSYYFFLFQGPRNKYSVYKLTTYKHVNSASNFKQKEWGDKMQWSQLGKYKWESPSARKYIEQTKQQYVITANRKPQLCLRQPDEPQIILAVGLQYSVLAHLREQHSMAWGWKLVVVQIVINFTSSLKKN